MAENRVPYIIELIADDKKLRQSMKNINWEEILGASGKGFSDVMASDAADAKDKIKKALSGTSLVDWQSILGEKEFNALQQAIVRKIQSSKAKISLLDKDGDTKGIENVIDLVSALGSQFKALGGSFDVGQFARSFNSFMKVLTPISAKMEELANAPEKVSVAFDRMFSGNAIGNKKQASQGFEVVGDAIGKAAIKTNKAIEDMERALSSIDALSSKEYGIKFKFDTDLESQFYTIDEEVLKLEDEIETLSKKFDAMSYSDPKFESTRNNLINNYKQIAELYRQLELIDEKYVAKTSNESMLSLNDIDPKGAIEESRKFISNLVNDAQRQLNKLSTSTKTTTDGINIPIKLPSQLELVKTINKYVSDINNSKAIHGIKIGIDNANFIEDKSKGAYGDKPADDDVNTTNLVAQTEKRFEQIKTAIGDKQDQILDRTKTWRKAMLEQLKFGKGDFEFNFGNELFESLQSYLNEQGNELKFVVDQESLKEQLKTVIENSGMTVGGISGGTAVVDPNAIANAVAIAMRSILTGKPLPTIEATDSTHPEVQNSIDTIVNSTDKYVKTITSKTINVDNVIQSLRDFAAASEKKGNGRKAVADWLSQQGIDINAINNGATNDKIIAMLNEALMKKDNFGYAKGSYITDALNDLKRFGITKDSKQEHDVQNVVGAISEMFKRMDITPQYWQEAQRRQQSYDSYEYAAQYGRPIASIGKLRQQLYNNSYTMKNFEDEGYKNLTSEKYIKNIDTALSYINAIEEKDISNIDSRIANAVQEATKIKLNISELKSQSDDWKKKLDLANERFSNASKAYESAKISRDEKEILKSEVELDKARAELDDAQKHYEWSDRDLNNARKSLVRIAGGKNENGEEVQGDIGRLNNQKNSIQAWYTNAKDELTSFKEAIVEVGEAPTVEAVKGLEQVARNFFEQSGKMLQSLFSHYGDKDTFQGSVKLSNGKTIDINSPYDFLGINDNDITDISIYRDIIMKKWARSTSVKKGVPQDFERPGYYVEKPKPPKDIANEEIVGRDFSPFKDKNDINLDATIDGADKRIKENENKKKELNDKLTQLTQTIDEETVTSDELTKIIDSMSSKEEKQYAAKASKLAQRIEEKQVVQAKEQIAIDRLTSEILVDEHKLDSLRSKTFTNPEETAKNLSDINVLKNEITTLKKERANAQKRLTAAINAEATAKSELSEDPIRKRDIVQHSLDLHKSQKEQIISELADIEQTIQSKTSIKKRAEKQREVDELKEKETKLQIEINQLQETGTIESENELKVKREELATLTEIRKVKESELADIGGAFNVNKKETSITNRQTYALTQARQLRDDLMVAKAQKKAFEREVAEIEKKEENVRTGGLNSREGYRERINFDQSARTAFRSSEYYENERANKKAQLETALNKYVDEQASSMAEDVERIRNDIRDGVIEKVLGKKNIDLKSIRKEAIKEYTQTEDYKKVISDSDATLKTDRLNADERFQTEVNGYINNLVATEMSKRYSQSDIERRANEKNISIEDARKSMEQEVRRDVENQYREEIRAFTSEATKRKQDAYTRAALADQERRSVARETAGQRAIDEEISRIASDKASEIKRKQDSAIATYEQSEEYQTKREQALANIQVEKNRLWDVLNKEMQQLVNDYIKSIVADKGKLSVTDPRFTQVFADFINNSDTYSFSGNGIVDLKQIILDRLAQQKAIAKGESDAGGKEKQEYIRNIDNLISQLSKAYADALTYGGLTEKDVSNNDLTQEIINKTANVLSYEKEREGLSRELDQAIANLSDAEKQNIDTKPFKASVKEIQKEIAAKDQLIDKEYTEIENAKEQIALRDEEREASRQSAEDKLVKTEERLNRSKENLIKVKEEIKTLEASVTKAENDYGKDSSEAEKARIALLNKERYQSRLEANIGYDTRTVGRLRSKIGTSASTDEVNETSISQGTVTGGILGTLMSKLDAIGTGSTNIEGSDLATESTLRVIADALTGGRLYDEWLNQPHEVSKAPASNTVGSTFKSNEAKETITLEGKAKEIYDEAQANAKNITLKGKDLQEQLENAKTVLKNMVANLGKAGTDDYVKAQYNLNVALQTYSRLLKDSGYTRGFMGLASDADIKKSDYIGYKKLAEYQFSGQGGLARSSGEKDLIKAKTDEIWSKIPQYDINKDTFDTTRQRAIELKGEIDTLYDEGKSDTEEFIQKQTELSQILSKMRGYLSKNGMPNLYATDEEKANKDYKSASNRWKEYLLGNGFTNLDNISLGNIGKNELHSLVKQKLFPKDETVQVEVKPEVKKGSTKQAVESDTGSKPIPVEVKPEQSKNKQFMTEEQANYFREGMQGAISQILNSIDNGTNGDVKDFEHVLSKFTNIPHLKDIIPNIANNMALIKSASGQDRENLIISTSQLISDIIPKLMSLKRLDNIDKLVGKGINPEDDTLISKFRMMLELMLSGRKTVLASQKESSVAPVASQVPRTSATSYSDESDNNQPSSSNNSPSNSVPQTGGILGILNDLAKETTLGSVNTTVGTINTTVGNILAKLGEIANRNVFTSEKNNSLDLMTRLQNALGFSDVVDREAVAFMNLENGFLTDFYTDKEATISPEVLENLRKTYNAPFNAQVHTHGNTGKEEDSYFSPDELTKQFVEDFNNGIKKQILLANEGLAVLDLSEVADDKVASVLQSIAKDYSDFAKITTAIKGTGATYSMQKFDTLTPQGFIKMLGIKGVESKFTEAETRESARKGVVEEETKEAAKMLQESTGRAIKTTIQRVGVEFETLVEKTDTKGNKTWTSEISNKYQKAMEATNKRVTDQNLSDVFGDNTKAAQALDDYTQKYEKLHELVEKFKSASESERSGLQAQIDALLPSFDEAEKKLITLIERKDRFIGDDEVITTFSDKQLKNTRKNLEAVARQRYGGNLKQGDDVAFNGYKRGQGSGQLYVDVLKDGIIKQYVLEVDRATGQVKEYTAAENALANAFLNVEKAMKQNKIVMADVDIGDLATNQDAWMKSASSPLLDSYREAVTKMQEYTAQLWNSGRNPNSTQLDYLMQLSERVIVLGKELQKTSGAFKAFWAENPDKVVGLDFHKDDTLRSAMERYAQTTATANTSKYDFLSFDNNTLNYQLTDVEGNVRKVSLVWDELYKKVAIVSDKSVSALDPLVAKIEQYKQTITDAKNNSYLMDTDDAKFSVGIQQVEELEQKVKNGTASFEELEAARRKAIGDGADVAKLAKQNAKLFVGTNEMRSATRQRDKIIGTSGLDLEDEEQATIVQQYTNAYDALIAKHKEYVDSNQISNPKIQEALRQQAQGVLKLGRQLTTATQEAENLHKAVENSGTYTDKYDVEHALGGIKEGVVAPKDMEATMRAYAQSVLGAELENVRFDSTTQTMTGSLRQNNKVVSDMVVKYNQAEEALFLYRKQERESLSGIPAFMRDVKAKTKGILQYLTGITSIYRIWGTIKQGVNYVKEIDSALTELKKVTDETEESYDRFLTTAGKTAGKVGSTIKEIVSSTADWARLNI